MTDYYEHKLDPVGTKPEWLEDDIEVKGFEEDGREFFGTHPARLLRWSRQSKIKIPADHWAVPALKAGKVPVRGEAWQNLAPKVAERMIALCREMAGSKNPVGPGISNLWKDEARAIMEVISPDPIKAALQDKWPVLDTDALRETLAKHNLKIVEAA